MSSWRMAEQCHRAPDAVQRLSLADGHTTAPGGAQRSRVRWSGWSGGFLEQDLLAGEAFEFGDELALAAQRGEAVVPVRAEVGELGGGVREQVPGDECDTRSHILRVNLADWR